ncbi:2-keto-4-pentenoate hydratase [Erythrobacter sp. LQ02-29]|uniref:2-keto-4-pentenoate hydratase n=1 Tax=Erythrobacter sp. LQ02-29 TaxID=2920384 RepID=UPI001F4EB209|nr:2-keto-4-pentenoate hydratase [Erythrobacter sp. LQ02-29]MCP9221217.1 2-keto-4-pentenoate hydratase [Erythrobacter sp. LQ02-29]
MEMARDIASAFVEARKSGRPIEEYPGERPTTLAAAYRVQDKALSLWDREVAGWKVGKINPPDSEALGANRLAGPIFTDSVQREQDQPAQFAIFDGGFAAVEAEFMLRLKTLDEPLPQTPREALRWIDEVRIGMEIASSPYAGINADGPCVTISDHGNNAGILLGKTVPEEMWDALDSVPVSVRVEDTVVGKATTADMLDGPFGAACFLLQNLADRGIEPRSGWWISSGAITGVHEVGAGQQVTASFGEIGSVEISTSIFGA